MSAIVFAGPSLAGEGLKHPGDIAFRPPAAHGDLYRSLKDRPRAIGLVDGYFETVPSVWHKEILFALSQGVHVLGAASMGALRAAELWRFGMVGIGAIFEAYRDGSIEDDDEVAVLHAPAELGYAPLGDAMVNIRATVAAATEKGVLGRKSGDAILRAAKALFYKERSWRLVLEAARAGGLTEPAGRRFKAWLRTHAIDQKRRDALLLVRRIVPLTQPGAPPFRADFAFEDTLDWRAAMRAFEEGRPASKRRTRRR